MSNQAIARTQEKSTTVRAKAGFFQTPAPIRWIGAVVARVAPQLAGQVLGHLFMKPARKLRPLRELRWLRHGRARAFEIAGGRTVRGVEWGDGDALVVLVHGWSGRGTQLGAFVAPLVDRGYRVVALDAPGHGDSDGDRSSIAAFADAIHGVARDLGPIHCIIAHSLGTAAVTLAASDGASIGAALFIAPPSDLHAYLEHLVVAFGMPTEIVDRVRRYCEQIIGRTWQSVEPLHLAPKMRIPMLAIHDEGDRDAPLEMAEKLVAAWPGARLITTRGLGHRRILRDSEVLRTGLRFVDLRSSDPGPSAQLSSGIQIGATESAPALRFSSGIAS